MPWPCCRPKTSTRRINRSSVPCKREVRFFSSRVSIRHEYTAAWVSCQPKRWFVTTSSPALSLSLPRLEVSCLPSYETDDLRASGSHCLLCLSPGPGVHQGQLHQVRIRDCHARRQEIVHRGVRAQGHVAPVPHHAAAHALQRWALRRGQLQNGPRPERNLRQGPVHFRLPGRARPLDVRGRVHECASPQTLEA